MPRKLSKKMPEMHELYRHILEMPKLPVTEIDEMRKHPKLLALTICEHVWGKKFS